MFSLSSLEFTRLVWTTRSSCFPQPGDFARQTRQQHDEQHWSVLLSGLKNRIMAIYHSIYAPLIFFTFTSSLVKHNLLLPVLTME